MKDKYCALDTLANTSLVFLKDGSQVEKKSDDAGQGGNKVVVTENTVVKPQQQQQQPQELKSISSSGPIVTAAVGVGMNELKKDLKKKKSSSEPGQNKGRFSKSEKKILFGVIREDPGLFHAFLHQRKERMYGTKSWMHEIASRYNQRAVDKRSLEAIRHHLMFRKTASKSDKNSDRVLFEHAEQCHQCDTCTKCLIFQRSCVQQGWAKCGYDLCSECDKSLPHVSKMIQGMFDKSKALRSNNNNSNSTIPSPPSSQQQASLTSLDHVQKNNSNNTNGNNPKQKKSLPKQISLDTSLLSLPPTYPSTPLHTFGGNSMEQLAAYSQAAMMFPFLTNLGISPTATNIKFFGNQDTPTSASPSPLLFSQQSNPNTQQQQHNHHQQQQHNHQQQQQQMEDDKKRKATWRYLDFEQKQAEENAHQQQQQQQQLLRGHDDTNPKPAKTPRFVDLL